MKHFILLLGLVAVSWRSSTQNADITMSAEEGEKTSVVRGITWEVDFTAR